MGNSDDSWPSGCLEKYWWIEGDEPFEKFPVEWAENSDQEEVATRENVDDEAISTNQDNTNTVDNPRIIELEDLTQYLSKCLYEQEEIELCRDAELTRVSALNDELVQRIAALSIYICKLWVELATSKGHEKRNVWLLMMVLLVFLVAYVRK